MEHNREYEVAGKWNRMCSTGLSFSDEHLVSGYILFIFLKTSKPRAEKTHHQSKEGHRVSAYDLKTGEMSNLSFFYDQEGGGGLSILVRILNSLY